MKKIMTLNIFILICMSMIGFVQAGDTYDFASLDINLLNQDPDPAEQGEYLELRWKIEKIGNEEMDDITFHLDLAYPFSFDAIDTPDKKLGGWIGFSDDDEYYILHYKVRVAEDALEDTYKVKLKVTYDITDEFTTDEYEIRIGAKTEPSFVLGTVVTSPLKLLSDTEENQMKITLENIGDENAENVKMKLELPEGFTPTYGYSDQANLGTVEADESETGIFYLDLDETIKEGEYESKLKISYKEADDENNVYKYLDMPFKIQVNGKPAFKIENVKTIPVKIKGGSFAQLLITVKNIGSKEAESVSIRALKESSQPFDFDEKSDFIGGLKPGESGEAILSFNVDKNANVKKYLLDVEIRGIFNDDVIVDEAIVPVNVENGEEKGFFGNASPLIGGIIIIGILVLGIGLYYFFNKKN